MRSPFLLLATFTVSLLAGCGGCGTPCHDATECGGGLCAAGVCTPLQGGGSACSSGAECGSGSCTQGHCDVGAAPDAGCASNADCASHSCSAGKCVAGQTPSGGACSTSAQCGAGSCNAGVCQAPAGCRKIDVVISVDNSGSMKEEKADMRNVVFPALATALKKVGGGLDDFRVGVLDACPRPANFHTRGVGGQCQFSTGKPWMDSNSPNLVEEFKCVGDIDSSGSACSGNNDDEQPASASAAALEPAAAATNAGFLRDDAVLLVMAITDEDEQPTPNMAAPEVYTRLVATKGGNVKRMVFLGVGGAKACTGAYGSAKQATKLMATTQLFVDKGRGVFWDLCAGKLEDGLTKAVEVIESACGGLREAGGGGTSCSSSGQCVTGRCEGGTCVGGSGGQPPGATCAVDDDCASAVCNAGKCAAGLQ